MIDGDMGMGTRDGQRGTEATTTRGRILTRAIPLLSGIGLFLSACLAQPVRYGYHGYAYDPFYRSFAFAYGRWHDWHHSWDHSHWDHGGCSTVLREDLLSSAATVPYVRATLEMPRRP
ncbi:MAG TPA: hypothetical protein VKK81_06980 [Candidatus Binatia bacterium]|nr:hypothetical protein [Candidatus Binatia bacterium]